ncbi:ribonuclease P protein subunit p20-like [Vespula maculifrons]|uniref:Ribonuclease P protein subunit p20 n=1 Tax=Vespula maculifrons TaxID=7453 RepID=A0ABD2B5G4_VESMC
MAEEHKLQCINKIKSEKSNVQHNITKTLLSSGNYMLRKRQPRLIREKRDIYVTNKTDFKAQLKKCEKLFNIGVSEIIIHGLGAAIKRACNLALQLKEIHHNSLDFDIKTSTEELIDDFEPLNDDYDYEMKIRRNSAIHIRVFRKEAMVHWLGLTIFEIWINLVSLTIFTILLALKLDDNYFLEQAGWWVVFSPLFIADGFNTYFCAIIFIRMHMEGMIQVAILRALWSLISLLLIFKLSGQSALEYSEVLSPVFILLQLIAVRACQLH